MAILFTYFKRKTAFEAWAVYHIAFHANPSQDESLQKAMKMDSLFHFLCAPAGGRSTEKTDFF